MSISIADLGIHSEIDRFWQGVDQRGGAGTGVDEAHVDVLTYSWGLFGTPLALPQPHYRLFLPSPYYIVGYGLVADAAGSAVVNVEYATRATGVAAVYTDVTGGSPPTLDITDWDMVLRPTWSPLRWAMFDLVHVYIFSTSGLTELTLQIFARRLPRVGQQSTVTDSAGNPIITSGGAPVILAVP